MSVCGCQWRSPGRGLRPSSLQQCCAVQPAVLKTHRANSEDRRSAYKAQCKYLTTVRIYQGNMSHILACFIRPTTVLCCDFDWEITAAFWIHNVGCGLLGNMNQWQHTEFIHFKVQKVYRIKHIVRCLMLFRPVFSMVATLLREASRQSIYNEGTCFEIAVK